MDKLPMVEAILERQARVWELNRRLAAGRRSQREGPWITVSRELGSGGTELAAALGAELGWQVFNQEILATISEHTHTRESVLSRLDERAIGPVIDYITRVLDPEIPGQPDFLKEMLRVIWGIAKRGNAIIVGRGANWFLNPRYGLRLRVVAPPEVRIRRLAAQLRCHAERAERRIQENDRRQEAFVRKVFSREINDPRGYDMVLNAGSLDPETARRAVLAALRQRFDVTAGA